MKNLTKNIKHNYSNEYREYLGGKSQKYTPFKKEMQPL